MRCPDHPNDPRRWVINFQDNQTQGSLDVQEVLRRAKRFFKCMRTLI